MIKGIAQKVEGVVSTVLETITGFGTTIGNNIATGVGAVVTEATPGRANEKLRTAHGQPR